VTVDASDRDGIRIVGCGRTDLGLVREENQDSLLVADLRSGETAARSPASIPAAATVAATASTTGPFDFGLGAEGAVLLVADGMGGRAGGARASSLTVSTVHEVMTGSERSGGGHGPFAGLLRRALTEANSAVYEAGSRGDEYDGMGTTATLAGLMDGFVFVAQVGDSRAYLVRQGRILRLTRDQSLVQDLIDSGIMSEDDEHNVRDNMLLQALGVGASVRPEMTYHELRRGDVVLLCSDGLSGVVRDEEIRRAVEEAGDHVTLCDRLVQLANERGGGDNITVLAARVEGAGVEVPREGDEMSPRRWESSPE
jgi:PPM family protein phosphatase